MLDRLLPALSAGMLASLCLGQAPSPGAIARIPIAAGFPTPPPVLGLSGVKASPMFPSDVQAIRRLMDSQPFEKGSASGAAGGLKRALSGKAALILYDTGGAYGYIGNMYARQLAALFTHFSMTSTLMPVEQYAAGAMKGYTATFYLGTTYQDPLPASFLADAMAAPKPLVWMGYNLWQIAWTAAGANNPAFTAKFGFQFNYMDGQSYSTVTYKGVPLRANPTGLGLANVGILKSTIAKTLATASTTGGATTPYLLHAGNLWFTGENPLENAASNRPVDRSAVIEDAIHDVIADGIVTGQHRAIIRIESIHAQTSPDTLNEYSSYLAGANVPYAVSVVPHYRDPRGYYSGHSPEDMTINDSPSLITALKGMTASGGQIVMQGDTHQHDNAVNPVDGVTTDDMEFYLVQSDPATGNLNYIGPAGEDSASWVHGKVQEGLLILKDNGWSPQGWMTPLYMASFTDYREFASDFGYSLDRGATFTADANGNVYFATLSAPWPIVDDLGMARMPENEGYFSTKSYGVWEVRPDGILQAAAWTKAAIRDGWFGCYFHPIYSVDLLAGIVAGVKGKGFTFVSPGRQWVGQ